MNSKGFSLAELLVAVALSGVIFIGISLLMISLFQSNSRVRQIDRIEQTKNDLVIDLTNAIRWSRTITFQTNTLAIQQSDSSISTYLFQNERLYKNNSPVTPPDVLIRNFKATNVGTYPSLPLVEVSLDITDKQFPAVSESVRFVVSQRVSTVTAGTTR